MRRPRAPHRSRTSRGAAQQHQHQRHAEPHPGEEVTGWPPSRAMQPMPIRLGGVPTGVAMPPTDAANDVISIMLMAKRRTRVRRRRAAQADVADDRQADREHHRGRRRVADPHRDQRRHAAVGDEHPHRAGADQPRRQRRERDAPIEAVHEHRLGQHEAADEQEDDRIGERGQRRRAGATWKTTASAGPSSAVTAIGSASVTHSTTTIAIIAARRWAGAGQPASAAAAGPAAARGARKRPAVRRRRLKRSSAGE